MKKKNVTIIHLVLLMLLGGPGLSMAQKTLSVTGLQPMETVLIGDTVTFEVTVGVTEGLNPSSVVGDIYYWYWTDEMMQNSIPARKLGLDAVVENVYDGFIDYLDIDIRPTEIRTTPVNLIILWPAMVNPAVTDTQSISIWLTPDGIRQDQIMSTESYGDENNNKVYPSPAMQYVYIRPDELGKVEKVNLYTTDGKMVNTYQKEEIQSGYINLDMLETGYYLVELLYQDNTSFQTKIFKH